MHKFTAAVFYVLVLSIGSAAAISCPTGWDAPPSPAIDGDPRSCYKATTTLHTRAECETECLPGALACVSTDAENLYLFIVYVDSFGGPGGYIGYTDKSAEGNWQWEVGGESCSTSYTNWAGSEPNQHGGEEDCAVLLSRENPWESHSCGRWVDVSCGPPWANDYSDGWNCICEYNPNNEQMDGEQDPNTCSEDEDHMSRLGGFAPCYVLWAITVFWSIFMNTKAKNRAKQVWTSSELDVVRREHEKSKCGLLAVFIFCTIMHFVSALWLGVMWIPIGLGPCIFLGVILPIVCSCNGDQFLDRRRREIEAHQRSNAPAPEPTYLPVTSAQPNPTVAVATVIEVVPQSGMPAGMQAHEGHVIVKGGGKAGWSQDKSLSEQLAELNHAKEAGLLSQKEYDQMRSSIIGMP